MADDNDAPADSEVSADSELAEDAAVPQESAFPEESDALVSRLRVIDEQPLDQRAEAYVQLYEELRHALEGADNAGLK